MVERKRTTSLKGTHMQRNINEMSEPKWFSLFYFLHSIVPMARTLRDVFITRTFNTAQAG